MSIPRGRLFCSPWRGLVPVFLLTHGLRPFGKLRAGCGLHSAAALRLGWGRSFCALCPWICPQCPQGLKPASIFGFYAALKRRSSKLLRAVLRLLDYSLINVKNNVKGNGQECPFHTGKVEGNINFKNDAEGVRGSHPSQKTVQSHDILYKMSRDILYTPGALRAPG